MSAPMAKTKRDDASGLSSADLRRLQTALGRERIAADEPLFAATSINRRINGEAALLLGGGRALLMQIAHPLVAEGVARFSNFREDPLARLWRTLELTLAISFAPAAAAMRAVREIERAHARVRGTLSEAVGPFPAGTPYYATDSELMFWVQATLIDSALIVYERFVAPLSAEEKDEYYSGAQIMSRVLGIEERHIPPSRAAFEEYLDDMLAGEVLTVGASGREVAQAVLFPRRPLGLSEAVAPLRLLTFELLPRTLRERFEVESSPLTYGLVEALGGLTRALSPWLPAPLRAMPYARR